MVTVFWSVYRAISSAADACVCAVAGIDPNDPEAQRAATKIQAVFRGHKTRKTMRAGDAQDQNEPTEAELAAEFRADDKELCNAATKIQAQFRGHMARKTTPKEKTAEDLSKEMEKLDAKEEVDIDLTDPELHKAASKIQASFRGHKARKEGDPKEGGDDGKAGDSGGASQ
ncbi:neuromodulin isoform X1 [Schistocerca americana]|uniref:neuromodulin isoform X1 n=1 Tax=Schistocerca americana TaxID=7009 RepID=UPI001F5017D4|nr:neuromodulin isoform X1 [Schistocerca americana]XP_047105692.1 neuromodulin isoform X1 [Schistocerca piceifrons]XP_049774685.1 neuromodulin isoform X1 [Schistocerca cancellata]XP_049801819.1 neuromodulin isoform X1 [Schistocerca nitens]XP_049950233.1 neuromodulin isoform X1 [Schistocerca serialis cubense]